MLHSQTYYTVYLTSYKIQYKHTTCTDTHTTPFQHFQQLKRKEDTRLVCENKNHEQTSARSALGKETSRRSLPYSYSSNTGCLSCRTSTRLISKPNTSCH